MAGFQRTRITRVRSPRQSKKLIEGIKEIYSRGFRRKRLHRAPRVISSARSHPMSQRHQVWSSPVWRSSRYRRGRASRPAKKICTNTGQPGNNSPSLPKPSLPHDIGTSTYPGGKTRRPRANSRAWFLLQAQTLARHQTNDHPQRRQQYDKINNRGAAGMRR
jgi:hypothetical protein